MILSIIIPVYNEEKTIIEILGKIKSNLSKLIEYEHVNSIDEIFTILKHNFNKKTNNFNKKINQPWNIQHLPLHVLFFTNFRFSEIKTLFVNTYQYMIARLKFT